MPCRVGAAFIFDPGRRDLRGILFPVFANNNELNLNTLNKKNALLAIKKEHVETGLEEITPSFH